MLRQRLIRSSLILFVLMFFSGCHVLVRLGKERSEASPAGEETKPEATPSRGPATPTPPLPGLDEEKPVPPPLPGLDHGDTQAAPSLRLDTTRDARRQSREIPAGTSENNASRVAPDSTRSKRDSRLWAIRKRLSGNTGINTNTAIAPGEGQFVYRTQLRFRQSYSSPGAVDRDINLLVNPQVLAYGVKENLTVFGVIPLVKRDGTARPPTAAGSFKELDDFGVGDMRFFAKYRFFEEDRTSETTRWSIFSGLEVPSYDSDFSSDSWDPFMGTVWTYQSLEWGFDWDLFWNFNTGKGVFRHDEMRYDAAYTYVLLTGQTLDEKFWQLNSIFELNGSYLTDGSHLLFAAPGFQLALPQIIVEASLQLPVIRDLKSAVEPDAIFVLGTRITW